MTSSTSARLQHAASQLKAKQSDLKERSTDVAGLIATKDQEIEALHAEIASLEHDCDAARADLKEVKAGKKSAGDELSKVLAAVWLPGERFMTGSLVGL